MICILARQFTRNIITFVNLVVQFYIFVLCRLWLLLIIQAHTILLYVKVAKINLSLYSVFIRVEFYIVLLFHSIIVYIG